MKRGKRILSALLVVCMVLTMMPMSALAATLDNTQQQNEAILKELKAFWGDDKTAEQALALLKEYGLVDEQGNIISDWSGKITIADGAKPVSFSDVFQYEADVITVNGRACPTKELKKILSQLTSLGVLKENTLRSDWKLTWNGQSIVPGALRIKLRDAQDNTEDSGTATMLGAAADEKTLLSILNFLDNYGLLSDQGAKTDWGLTIPGKTRPTDLNELTSMLKDKDCDRNQIITVDGKSITLGDFETMLDIEKEIKRIQKTYFSDPAKVLTPEHDKALDSLHEQLVRDGGIQLFNANAANTLTFPSGTDHAQRITVPENVTMNAAGQTTLTIALDHPAKKPVSLHWEIQDGSVNVSVKGQKSGTLSFKIGQQQKTLTLKSGDSERAWNGNAYTAMQFTNPVGALFSNEKAAITTRVTVTNSGYDKFPPDHSDFNRQAVRLDWPVYPNSHIYTDLPDGIFNPVGTTQYFPQNNWGTVTYHMEVTDQLRAMMNNGVISHVEANITNEFWSNGDQGTADLKADLYVDDPNSSPDATCSQIHNSSPDWENIRFPIDPWIKNAHDLYVKVTFRFSENTKHGSKIFFNGIGLVDGAAPTVTGATAPAGTYSPGQQVPVTVDFSEFIKTDPMHPTIAYIGAPYDTDHSVVCQNNKYTFLVDATSYGTPAVSYVSDLSDKNGNKGNDMNSRNLENVIIAPDIYDALKTPQATANVTPVYDEKTGQTTATAKVEIPLPDKQEERDLLIGSYTNSDGVICNDKVAASIDGGKTLVPFTYDDNTNPGKLMTAIPIDVKDIQPSFVMEIYHITTENNKPVKGDIVLGRYGAFSVSEPVPLRTANLSFSQPDNWPTEDIYLNSAPDLQLTAQLQNTEGCTWTQYQWKSTNEAVATIDANGKISFLTPGTVQFYLAATNGGIPDYQGAGFESDRTPEITVKQGATPYIKIAQKELTIRTGEPVTVRWASNIAQKNEEYAPNIKTDFTITVKNAAGAVVQTKTVTFDPRDKGKTDEEKALWPNQAYTFSNLDGISEGGQPSYTISVSGKADANVPGYQEKGFVSEDMKVFVVSKPVTVRLTRPEELVITDEQPDFTVKYNLENFDSQNHADFRVTVTDNATGKKVPVGEVAPASSGSFTFPITVSNGFRNIYDVTVEAKNPAENSWSRDSFTLYVYDQSCLNVIVQNVENDRVVSNGDQVTMDNNKWISSLSQDEILALKRDINLKSLLSINYGDHDWSEAIDRMEWSSTDSKVASINYPMQSTYSNIEGLSYTSFAPATQFLLSGNSDGEAVVKAMHSLAGDSLSSQAKIDVKTLKNRLYLFQSYPACEATLTYTNGKGEKKTTKSNEKGQAAIYEESGIKGQVYFEGKVKGTTYLGTFYNADMKTGENDAASLELYPLNTINMKMAATAPIYLKNPDGTDFTGDVQVRTGVYRNGVYCGAARVDNQSAGIGSQATDYTVHFEDGKHIFHYDLDQFDRENQGEVGAKDQIVFAFELRTNGNYPVFFQLSGSRDGYETIRLGEQIVNLKTVPAANKNKPFLARQMVYFSSTAAGAGIDMTGVKGRVGPSRDNPEMLLETLTYWWGRTDGDDVSIFTKEGVKLPLQEVKKNRYPFTSSEITVTDTPINETTFQGAGIEDLASMPLAAHYNTSDGRTIKSEDLPFTIVNAISVKSAESPDDWKRNFDQLRAGGNQDCGGLTLGDGFIQTGLDMATKLSVNLGFLKLQLSPTEDPLVYNGFVYAGMDAIQDDNVSGAQADVSRGSDLDPGPGLKEIKSVFKNGLKGYGKQAADELGNAAQILKHSVKSQKGGKIRKGQTSYVMSGYFETRVYYDEPSSSWKMVLVNGGFSAGGGYGRHWTNNLQVGPVPMFLDLGFGASAVVNFKVAVNSTMNYNDYLTELRLDAYAEAFGGFGFDYTVLAVKIGLFGQLNLDLQLRWLNAMEAPASDPEFGFAGNINGSVGAKFQLKILFVSYEEILWSHTFHLGSFKEGDWDNINKYWDAVGKGTYGDAPTNTRLLRADPVSVDQNGNTTVFEAQGEPTLTARDYLTGVHHNRWGNSQNGSGLHGARNGMGMDTVLSPSYPEANPVLSTDGSYMFYLDDLDNPKDATALRVAAAPRQGGSGGTYRKGTILDDNGYGDSYVKSAGTGENSVVVWSRLMEKPPITEPGEVVTPNIQAMMMNSSDIMVATRKDGAWKTEQLTNNENIADTAPAVATNGDRTVVVWRQTISSDINNITDFSAKDYIMYQVKEGDTWTKAAPLYTGDLGGVKGLEAQMLPGGQTLVTFIVDTTGAQDCSGQEVVYAMIASKDAQDGSCKKNEVSRFVRLTNDDYLDENPQLAWVKDQGKDYFILGWHSLNSGDGVPESDIRLAAIDENGNRRVDFVNYLSDLTDNTYSRIGSNFHFVKNASSLNDLSILWADIDAGEGSGDEKNASKGKISGIRFRENDGKIGVTATQDLAMMDDNTLADLFDGYVGRDGRINLLVLGTSYNMNEPQANFVSDGVGVQTVFTPEQTTSIYKASGEFSDSMLLEAPVPDYEHIRLGAELPVLFHVTNMGVTPITEIAIKVGDDTTSFKAGDSGSFTPLQPGESRDLFASCTLPSDKIRNTTFKLNATFESGKKDKKNGEITLAIPDLGITSNEPLLKAQDGKRTLQFTLFNSSDAALKGSKNQVCFNLFTDSACTMPVDPQYLTLIHQANNTADSLLTISDDTSLGKIDEGRYSLQYSFDAGAYIKQEENGKKPFADENGEIRDGGITLYAKAWIETPDQDQHMGEMLEYNSENNISAVKVESLLKQADHEPVSIQSEVTSAENQTKVKVMLQNNSIVQRQNGNLAVTLLDGANNVIGWQQSYDADEGLLSLSPEQHYTRDFTFDVKDAARALVTYDQKVTLNDDADLNQFSVQGVPVTLSDFTLQEDGTYAATATAEDVTNAVVIATPDSTKSRVTITANTPDVSMGLAKNGKKIDSVKTVAMSPGGSTTITVTVTAQNNSTKTYVLTITNKNSKPDINSQPLNATATYGADEIRLTVSARTPGNENARLTYQWYEYTGQGAPKSVAKGTWVPVEGATKAEYVIDRGAISAGMHYYYCKVTSANAAGGSFVADSNIATVNVGQADTPQINWPKIRTTLTFGDPLSEAAKDLKTGSLTFPNQYKPGYGIGTFAWVQPDSIPTTDTEKANAVYTPSSDIQTNYKSFALEHGGVPTMLDISVKKAAAPTVTWPVASTITYGQTLADAKLSGGKLNFGSALDFTQNAAFSNHSIGEFSWHEPNAVPGVTNYGSQVDYSPGDFVKTNYETIHKTTHTTALTVNRAKPTVNVTTDASTQKIGNPVTATITVTNPNNAALTTGFPKASQVRVTGSLGGEPQSLQVKAVKGKPGVYQAAFSVANDRANIGKKLTFSVTLTQSDNYLAADQPVTAEVGITDKSIHVQSLTGSQSVIYGDAARFTTRLKKASHGEASSRQPSGTVSYALNGNNLSDRDQTLTVTETGGTATLTLTKSDLPAGSYTLKAHYSGDGNYQASDQSFHFTVVARPVTARADNITAYAGGIPLLTVSCDNLPEGVTALTGVTAQTQATAASSAGGYAITLTGVTGDDAKNYDVTLVPGILTLKPCTNETPIALPDKPDVEKHIPAVSVGLAEQEALKGQLTGKNLENLKLMVTPIGEKSGEARALLARLDGYRAPENGAGFYDVSLVDAANHNKVLNFDGSATLTFPYPKDTKPSGYRFVILHLKDGAVSAYTPTATEDGLKITVRNGFSPFLVAYGLRSSDGSGSGVTVTVSGSKGGTVSPALSSLKYGAAQTFTFTPDKGYRVADVKVNGVSVGAVESYTVKRVTGDLVIEVTFEPVGTLPFVDVPETAWYHKAVEYVYGHKLFAGTSDTTFSPDATMTRAMLVTVLYRAAGQPDIKDEMQGNLFADVDAASWYGTAVYWARLKGITSGIDGKTFLPDGSITREQLAVMLYRYAGSPAITGTLDGFTDGGTADSYATDALKWAVGQGILSGRGDGILDPTGAATRAQVAVMLMQYLSTEK